MRIITINREFGSGGREFGKRLADSLGVAYYDYEILEALSKKLAMDQNYLEHVLETNWQQNYSLSFGKTLSSSRFVNTNSFLLAEQHKLIKQLATQSDCVIVGRNANLVLEALNPLKIFVYADTQSKITRCRARELETEKFSDKEWIQKIKSIDKMRSETHDMLNSEYPWGDKRGYDICFNTSSITIKNIIPSVKQFVLSWFEEQNHGN